MPNLLEYNYLSEFLKFSNELGWFANITGIVSFFAAIYFASRSRVTEYARKRNHDRRRKTNRKMNDPAYLAWVLRVVSRIYAGLEFVSIYGRKHPAVIFRAGKTFAYPFTGLCQLKSTEIADMKMNPAQKAYIALLGDSVKRPKMKGFATEEIILENGGVAAVNARTITYEQNLVTAHILEWELFQHYNKSKEITDDILSELTLRSVYHGNRPPAAAILKPSDAYPLISVQALVIYKDYKDPDNVKWKAVVAQRQENVAIKPELWQIPPAGGFEVYGHEDDQLEIQLLQGFDVRAALFREYAEELYNVEEMSFCKDGRDSGSILSEQHIAYLIKLIHSRKASVDFLGIITDLTILRHELSFLILIDDAGYCEHPILGSSESKKIFSMSLDDLRTTFSTQNVHSSSAGLLQLAIESDRLKENGIAALLAGEDQAVPS